MVQKKCPILFFIPKFCFTIFFLHIFQVVQRASLGNSCDTNMDPTGCYTMQQHIKIIEVYFATKSVLLTQRQWRRCFGRNNVNHCSLCGHLPHLLSPKIRAPNTELPFYQVHCSCQNLSYTATESDCQKNWCCGKLCLNDFYPLLHSIAFSSICIGVKRNSQAYCLHNLKNVEKNCKTQL